MNVLRINLIFILFLLSTNVFSQPATIVGSATAEPGDIVSIPIDYLGSPSVIGMQVDINFDNTVLNVMMNCNALLGGASITCTDHGTFIRVVAIDFSFIEIPSGSLGELNFTIDQNIIAPVILPLLLSNQEYSNSMGTSITPIGSTDGSISVEQLFVLGGVISNLESSVVLQNDLGDDLQLTSNGSFTFSTKLANSTNYNVTVLSQPVTPNQTCLVTGGVNGDGSGSIVNADDMSLFVDCNNTPIVSNDGYQLLEDSILIASDTNGSINDHNDDSVLVNDTDSDVLTVFNPGTFNPIAGIGGSLTINSDGTFNYTAPSNAFGLANFMFEVTDGISIVPSELTIDVLPVNDRPVFEIIGDLDAAPLVFPPNPLVQFPNFAFNIDLGTFESSQLVQQFDLSIVSDTNNILNSLTTVMDNSGQLELDFTLNEGVAILQLTLQDDGGVDNGGIDTSNIVEFTVSYFEFIYADGFEDVIQMKFIESNSELTLIDEKFIYKNHFLSLYDTNQQISTLKKVFLWMAEIDSFESEKKL